VPAAEEAWDRAIRHFVEYLPRTVRHWIVAVEMPAHQAILARLVRKLGSTDTFVLGESAPARVHEAGIKYRTVAKVGFLEFVVHDGREDHQGVNYQDALMTFARWPCSRLKLCFDVWDDNFSDLFSEDPFAVEARCRRLRDVVGKASELVYRSSSPPSTSLVLNCANSRWVQYSGLERYDYMLPSGEVACRPTSVDGEVDIDGWIIGTLPFGLKYGRIRPDELRLYFENGEVVATGGTNSRLRADFDAILIGVPGLRAVGEVGLGQSRAVTRAAYLTQPGYQWHERHFGLHLGLGAELPETADPHNRRTNHHLDIVFARGSLTTDTAPLLTW
jgi:hypothetical protein